MMDLILVEIACPECEGWGMAFQPRMSTLFSCSLIRSDGCLFIVGSVCPRCNGQRTERVLIQENRIMKWILLELSYRGLFLTDPKGKIKMSGETITVSSLLDEGWEPIGVGSENDRSVYYFKKPYTG